MMGETGKNMHFVDLAVYTLWPHFPFSIQQSLSLEQQHNHDKISGTTKTP
jgi:hypothetical protein